MKKCANCGAELLDEAVFCSYCGTACEEDTATQLLAEEEEETTLLEESILQKPKAPSSETEDEATALLDAETLEHSSPDMEESTTVLEEKENTISSTGTQKETVTSSEEQPGLKNKKTMITVIVLFIVLAIIGISIFGSIKLNEALSNTAGADSTEGDYKGLHWELSSYLAGEKNVNYVEISGSGKLDEDFIFNNINLLETEQINIEGNIDICSDFGSFSSDKVKTVMIGENVEHIGFGALSGFSKLKTVFVFNKNLKIDFEEDDGLYETLGSSTSKVEISCYKGSTAEKYVKTWNEYTGSNYVLAHIEE